MELNDNNQIEQAPRKKPGEIDEGTEIKTDLSSPTKKPVWLYVVIVLVIIAAVGIAAYYFDKSKPAEDKSAEVVQSNGNKEQELSAEAGKDVGQNNWSTMDQGPYKDKVSYATSTDLLKWTDSGKILATHASVPDAVVKEGIIFAYFVDVSTDGIAEQTGMVKSIDGGKSWTERQIIKIDGIGNKAVADPDPYLLPDGKIRLYYYDILENRTKKITESVVNKIYSAISTDGVNFTQEDGVRLEYEMIFDPDVIKVGDTWRMYAGTDKNKVISATSTDGLNFTYEGIATENAGVPNIYYDGTKYLLYTAGIEIFTSTDGKTFTKTSNSFRITGGVTADPGVVKISEDKYLMVFKTSDAKPKN